MKVAEIIGKLDPWTVACAVGAKNGSLYGPVGTSGRIDLDAWLLLVNRKDWQRRTGEALADIESVLRYYAEHHKHEHMNEVYERLKIAAKAVVC